MDQITEIFLQELKERGVKKITLKNYKSDIKNFTDWVKEDLGKKGTNVDNLKECIPFMGRELVIDYKRHLEEIQTPTSTINRRLSTLRNLGNFLYEKEITDRLVTYNLTNINKDDSKSDFELIIEKYTQFLKASNVSKNTIKNYLADVKQFAQWYQQDDSDVNFN